MGSTGGLGAVRLEVDVFSSPPVIPIVLPLSKAPSRMTRTVTVDVDDISVADQAEDVKLRINVHHAKTLDEFNDVHISGTRSGLMFLAKQIIRIATSADESHTHLDRECHEPIYESDENWWLTIERDDKKWSRLERKVQKDAAAD